LAAAVSRFVQLTLNDEPILINAGHVLTVEPLEEGCRIQVSVHPGSFDVSENYDAVKDLLVMATNGEVERLQHSVDLLLDELNEARRQT
jgi:hypothetical protein